MNIEANGINNAGGGPVSEKQVEKAESWIKSHCSETKRVNTSWSSYYLKHVAEEGTGCYISNGAFIQAATNLGYRMHETFENSPNVSFNLSFKP